MHQDALQLAVRGALAHEDRDRIGKDVELSFLNQNVRVVVADRVLQVFEGAIGHRLEVEVDGKDRGHHQQSQNQRGAGDLQL